MKNNVSDASKIALIDDLLYHVDVDTLYVSLHNVLLDSYGHNLENSLDGAATELYHLRLVLEAIGKLKGINYYPKN